MTMIDDDFLRIKNVLGIYTRLDSEIPICPSCYHPLMILEDDNERVLYCSNQQCLNSDTYPIPDKYKQKGDEDGD